jgi:hypothetical protein
MNRHTFQIHRSKPWLNAAIVIYLLGAVLMIAVHQHHDALHATDCALCTMAHTPAMVAPISLQVTEQTTRGFVIPIPEIRGWDSEVRQTSRSRAPPQA